MLRGRAGGLRPLAQTRGLRGPAGRTSARVPAREHVVQRKEKPPAGNTMAEGAPPGGGFTGLWRTFPTNHCVSSGKATWGFEEVLSDETEIRRHGCWLPWGSQCPTGSPGWHRSMGT